MQPNAVIWGDAGPDVRWAGNESGYANDPCWATYTPHNSRNPLLEACNGETSYQEATSGHRDGKYWMPAECNLSIRPGWFYHAWEDVSVKTPRQLLNTYYASVGRGGNLILNIPPDRRGQVHENDVRSFREWRRLLAATFSINLAAAARITASNTRGNDPQFAAANVMDDKPSTYWATDDGTTSADLVLDLGDLKTFNVVALSEYIELGQRVDQFALDVWKDEGWSPWATGSSIGPHVLLRGAYATTEKVRLRIVKAAACPCIGSFGLYAEPFSMAAPKIVRDGRANVTLSNEEVGPVIRYTLDGSDPTTASTLYTGPFSLPREGTVKARCFDSRGRAGDTATAQFGLSKMKWKVVSVDSEEPAFQNQAAKAIDDDPTTFWHTQWHKSQPGYPHEIVIDLGELLELSGFTYLPRQDGQDGGLVARYELYTSEDARGWTKSASGEFGNILHSPTLQRVKFAAPRKVQYLRFVALSSPNRKPFAGAAEIGVLLAK